MTIQQEELSVTIHRPANGSLGISIAGGIGSTPYKDNDHVSDEPSRDEPRRANSFSLQGIFLMKVNQDGAAGDAGLLVGDKVLSVNGTSLINCEHNQAVAALKAAGDTIEMLVLREILSSPDENAELSQMKEGEKYSTVVQRDEKSGGNFGFSIAGGQSDSTSTSKENEHFYISKIDETNEKNSLAVGDRLLAINSRDTSDLTHDQAVQMLKNGDEQIELVLYREKPVETPKTINDNSIEVNQRDENANDATNSSLFQEAKISKGDGPMGLSIVGGIDQACPPFGKEQRGVFVSKVNERRRSTRFFVSFSQILSTGSAARTNLRVGDRILRVNQRDVSQATHNEAVQALLQATNDVLLVVRHDPQPAGLKVRFLPFRIASIDRRGVFSSGNRDQTAAGRTVGHSNQRWRRWQTTESR